jgi:hypothetical protein
MIGLIKNNIKVPCISLESFVDNSRFIAAKQELALYKQKQDKENAELFIGFNGTDWNADEEFQKRQRQALPKTWEHISVFAKEIVPFNIRWSSKEHNTVLLHHDWQPSLPNVTACKSLIPDYKQHLKTGYWELLKNKADFKIVTKLEDANPEYNAIDLDFEAVEKAKLGEEYWQTVKHTYKLHMVMSDEKTLFVYDNVKDEIHNLNSVAAVFNARDYHDTFLESWGISIQFPMNPYFLREEIQKYLELI